MDWLQKALDSDKLTAFWLAKKDEIRIYSCTGGFSGEYLIGHVFNTCILKEHELQQVNLLKKI